MRIDTYQARCADTDVGGKTVDFYIKGMIEEFGEFIGIEKRIERGDYEKMRIQKGWTEKEMLNFIFKSRDEEIGDFMWYFARFCSSRNHSIAQIIQNNDDKVHRRLEEGTILGEGER